MIDKLALLGWEAGGQAARTSVQLVYTLLLVPVAVLTARTQVPRAQRVLGSLALLNLAALASGGAWSDYVPATSVWLVALAAAEAASHRRKLTALVVVGFFAYFVPGAIPYGSPSTGAVAVLASMASTLVLIGFNGWVALRGVRLSAVVRDAAPALAPACVSPARLPRPSGAEERSDWASSAT